MKRSTQAAAWGARTGVRITRTPAPLATSSKVAANLLVVAEEELRPAAEAGKVSDSTVTESSQGPGTSKENDDHGVREAQHRYDAGFAKVRAYARAGQEVTEAALTMMPGLGSLYDLKLTVDEAQNGNWTPALIRAGIVLAPGAIVAVAKVGGKWVAKVVAAGGPSHDRRMAKATRGE